MVVVMEEGIRQKVDTKDPGRVVAVALLTRINGLHGQILSAGDERKAELERALNSALKEVEEKGVTLIYNPKTNRYRLPKTEAVAFDTSPTARELAEEMATHYKRLQMETQIQLHTAFRNLSISADEAASAVVQPEWKGGSACFNFELVREVSSLIGRISAYQDIITELLGNIETESEQSELSKV